MWTVCGGEDECVRCTVVQYGCVRFLLSDSICRDRPADVSSNMADEDLMDDTRRLRIMNCISAIALLCTVSVIHPCYLVCACAGDRCIRTGSPFRDRRVQDGVDRAGRIAQPSIATHLLSKVTLTVICQSIFGPAHPLPTGRSHGQVRAWSSRLFFHGPTVMGSTFVPPSISLSSSCSLYAAHPPA